MPPIATEFTRHDESSRSAKGRHRAPCPWCTSFPQLATAVALVLSDAEWLTEQVAAIAEARSQARTRPDRGIHQMLTPGPPNASPNLRCVLLTREYKSISAGSGTAPALAAGRITYFT